MIFFTKCWFRIALITLLIFSASFPLFKKEASDFVLLEQGIEGITSQLSEGAWEFIQDAANSLKNRIFEEDKPVPLTPQERFMGNIRTGWQYGLSSIGAAEKALHDWRFNMLHSPSILSTTLLGILLLEIIFLLFQKHLGKHVGILGMIGLLVCLSIFGELNKDVDYSVVLGGLILFSTLQLVILFYSIIVARHSNAQSV